MARRRPEERERSLVELWRPPADAGEPIATIATTFELDATLYEDHLLPAFLRCGSDLYEEKRLFYLEREHRLQDTYAFVLVDGAHVAPLRSSPRWDQIAVQVRGGCLHSKVTVLAWAKTIRLLVGSANVTPGGYRLNHEIAFALDFQDDAASAPRALLLAFLDAIDRIASFNEIADPARERLDECLGSLRAMLRSWRSMPAEFAPKADLQLAPILVEPSREGSRGRRYFDQLGEIVGMRKFDECLIVSPFFDDADATHGDAAVDGPSRAVCEFLRVRSARASLMCRAEEKHPGDYEVQAPEAVRRTLSDCLSQGRLFVRPVAPRAHEKEGERLLHAKALHLRDRDADVQVLVAGSSNFTSPGLGLREAGRNNFEANLAIVTRGRGPEAIDLDELRTPGGIEKPSASVDFVGALRNTDELVVAAGDEEPATRPPFDLAATFDPAEGRLRMVLHAEPPSGLAWIVRLPGDEGHVTLWSAQDRAAGQLEHERSLLLKAVPSAVRLEWSSAKGPHHAHVPVTVIDRASLPAAEEMRALSLEEFIGMLVTGCSPWDYMERIGRRGCHRGAAGAEIDPHRCVDTSRYLTVRTRRFSHAIAALRERLGKQTPVSLEGLRSMLFGPTGPATLARTAAASIEEGSSSDGKLPRDLGAFLLAELYLAVAWMVPPPAPPGIPPARIAEEWNRLLDEVRKCADNVAKGGPLGDAISAYVGRALKSPRREVA